LNPSKTPISLQRIDDWVAESTTAYWDELDHINKLDEAGKKDLLTLFSRKPPAIVALNRMYRKF